jgi:putative DNA primase/helicase
LKSLLVEFPFVDETARAVAHSGMMAPILRGAFAVAPMHVISAPAPATGKSYLLDTVASIAIGRPMPVIAAGRDEAETEKRLIGICLRSQPIVSIDNFNGILEGDFLCQMIERPFIEPRLLGGLDMPTIENKFAIYGTGNNIRSRGDVVRRRIEARLDANMPHPEQRSFKIKPDQVALAARGQYIAAILTIARAFIVAGMPGKLPPYPSFEGWSDFVRSPLVWLGCDDPVNTVSSGYADDDREAEAAALFAAWPRGTNDLTSYTSAQLIETAQEYDQQRQEPLRPELLEALRAVGRDRRGNLNPTTLGQWLRDRKDKVIGALKLKRKGTTTRPTWTVETL